MLHACEKIDKRILKGNKHLNIKQREGIGLYLDKIENQLLGNPVTVRYFDRDISFEYLQSVEELFFLESKLEKISSILEIGTGFGRTCHALLSNFCNIKNYVICDLPKMLSLSKNYLTNVLPFNEFNKIDFISHEEFHEQVSTDLVINIDSFQEMDEITIKNYIEIISNISRFFYTKNTTCKYDPISINLKNPPNFKQYQYAMKMGLCRNVVDIFDTEKLFDSSKKYVKVYCPKNFRLVKEEPSLVYKQYHSALFSKY